MDGETIKVSGTGAAGVVGQVGGAGILRNGVQASANFGFVGIDLSGAANIGAELSLGFNTNADALDDSRLTLQELVDGLGDILDLMAPPDIAPLDDITPLTSDDYGRVE